MWSDFRYTSNKIWWSCLKWGCASLFMERRVCTHLSVCLHTYTVRHTCTKLYLRGCRRGRCWYGGWCCCCREGSGCWCCSGGSGCCGWRCCSLSFAQKRHINIYRCATVTVKCTHRNSPSLCRTLKLFYCALRTAGPNCTGAHGAHPHWHFFSHACWRGNTSPQIPL